MDVRILEVDGIKEAEQLHKLNNISPHLFPPLRERHLESGHWWIIYVRDQPKAFAGLVPKVPYDVLGVGYLKRCWVDPRFRGRGWQKILLEERERKAKSLGWKMLVGEVKADNEHSISNFIRSGYIETLPEQPWASDSRYFVKMIA